MGLLLLGVVGALLGGGWLAFRWMQSPSGAHQVSGWVTARVERQVPGTKVTVEQIRLRWPPRVEAYGVRWGQPGREPILMSDQVFFKVKVIPRFSGFLQWTLEGWVDRLDAGALDQAVAQGDWKAKGFFAGEVFCEGSGSTLQNVTLHLDSKAPGGTLRGEVIEQLVNFMPPGDKRTVLLKAVQAQSIFHFKKGTVALGPDQGVYRLNFLLDGDHLLDITVRTPRNDLDVLGKLLKEVFL